METRMKCIALLGATGSIGTSTIDVVTAYPDKYKIVSFSFNQNIEKGRHLIKQLLPKYVAVGSEKMALELQHEFPNVEFGYGIQGLTDASTLSDVDIVLTAVMGSVGLIPTLAAIQAKKDIALANKETLVMGGELVMAAVKEHNVKLLPVDSEHSAIFQCLEGQSKKNVKELLITASGGSFRDLSRDELKEVTLEQALSHPNWAMGKKITIDSSTMVNKGLEVIEAHWLFNQSYDTIKVIQHRESIIHSMIVMNDGAYLAQLGASDMREAIQYALTYPNRLPIKNEKLFDLVSIGTLHFEELSFDRFPMIRLAYEVGKAGGTATTVYNASNEIAVEAFLARQISYLEIELLVERMVETYHNEPVISLEQLLTVDKETRICVKDMIRKGVTK